MLALDGKIKPGSELATFLGIEQSETSNFCIDFEELSIDSDGKVDLKGGGLDLSDLPVLPLGPFALQVERIGLRRSGKEGKYRELSFAGEIALVEGMPAAKAAQGITIKWKADDPSDIEIIPEKASIQLTIPGALAFRGSIAKVKGDEQLFRGSAALDVKAANFKLGASILAGSLNDDIVFYLFVEVESPVPIPLGQSGLGIYGIKAGVGLNSAPNIGEGELLIDLYRNKAPTYDLADANKMKAQTDSATVLAGVMLGTAPDASFAARFGGMMMLSVPGPLLFIEAKAQLIELPVKISAEEFDANSTVVAGFAFDLDKEDLWIALKADFEIPTLIKVGGTGEAYFDFKDASKWHLYLGKETPRSNRIKGELLSQYRGEGYLMLDAVSMRTGARFGYGPVFKKGPLKAACELFVEGGVFIGWEIRQADGRLIVGGEAALQLFGLGPRALLQGTLRGTMASPTKLSAVFEVQVNLTWPLEPFQLSFPWEITFERPPKIENPIADAALSHKHVPLVWHTVDKVEDLPESSLPGMLTSLAAPEGAENDASSPRLVPLDANPLINFIRPMGDQAGPIAYPLREEWATEIDGVYKISFGLKILELRPLDEDGNPQQPVSNIKAVWVPSPGGGSALQLLSDTPFPGYTIGSWESIIESGTGVFRFYDEPKVFHHAMFFDSLPLGLYDDRLLSPDGMMTLPLNHGDVLIDSDTGFSVVPSSIDEHVVIILAPGEELDISIPDGWWDVQIVVPSKQKVRVEGRESLDSQEFVAVQQGEFGGSYMIYRFSRDNLRIKHLCIAPLSDDAIGVVALLWETRQGFSAPATRWETNGNTVLEPNTKYSLTVKVAVNVELTRSDISVDLENLPSEFSKTFYFRTGGPPDSLAPYFLYASAGDPRPSCEFMDIPLDPSFQVPSYHLALGKGLPVYRSYDIRLHWSAPHIHTMYQESLNFRLFDQNGRLDDPTWVVTWERSPYRFLSTVDAAWLDAHGSQTRTGDDMLTLHVGNEPLPSKQTLTAMVLHTPDGNDEVTNCLLRFEFDTSNFLNLQDHLDSSGHRVSGVLHLDHEWAVDSVYNWEKDKAVHTWPLNKPALKPLTHVDSVFEEVIGSWDTAESESLAFMKFSNKLTVDLPLHTEYVEIYVVETTNGVPVAIYLSSPEPFHWERIEMACSLMPPPGYGLPSKSTRGRKQRNIPSMRMLPRSKFEVRALTNFDGRCAFLFYMQNEQCVPIPGGFHDQQFTLKWDIGHGAPIFSMAGAGNDSTKEDAHLRYYVEAPPKDKGEDCSQGQLQLTEELVRFLSEFYRAIGDRHPGGPNPQAESSSEKGGKR